MNLENLYHYHTFMELFKILKHQTPMSVYESFRFCPKNNKLLLMIPKVRLDVSQQILSTGHLRFGIVLLNKYSAYVMLKKVVS